MTNDNHYKMKRTIILNKLKPNEYHLWIIQTKTTFEIHKCLNLVFDNEPNPTSMDDDGTSIGPFDERLRVKINFWETRHALAREALLHSLKSTNIFKIIPHRDSVTAIWDHLKNEYNRPLNFKYIHVNNKFMSLYKDDIITMNAHITHFNQLLQEIEYNKPVTIPTLRQEIINLQFMLSLDKTWEIFSLIKDNWIR